MEIYARSQHDIEVQPTVVVIQQPRAIHSANDLVRPVAAAVWEGRWVYTLLPTRCSPARPEVRTYCLARESQKQQRI